MRTLTVVALFAITLPAQQGGLRAGTEAAPTVQRLGAPDPAVAERLITIEAVAEVRVVPSRLRVVFAVNAEGTTVPAASTACRTRLDVARDALLGAGIALPPTAIGNGEMLDTDFIAAVPIYTWGLGKQGDHNAIVETKTGYRAQYNVHVEVKDEAGALRAIEVATAGDGVELLAVDYWSDDLEAHQLQARKKAMVAAKQKADLLLSFFTTTPTPVNVHEETNVIYPQQLYSTIPHVEESAGSWYSRDELPRVPASRPRQTYYRGLFGTIDSGDSRMPGKRDIEVVSTVRLYYKAPERPVAETTK